jgi:hypothetical protein
MGILIFLVILLTIIFIMGRSQATHYFGFLPFFIYLDFILSIGMTLINDLYTQFLISVLTFLYSLHYIFLHYVQFSLGDIFNRFFFSQKLKIKNEKNTKLSIAGKIYPNSGINFSNKNYSLNHYSPLNLILNLKVLNNSISRLNTTQDKITNFIFQINNPVLPTANFINLVYYNTRPVHDIFINNSSLVKNRLNFTLSESSLISHNLLNNNLNINKQQSLVSIKSIRNIHEYTRYSKV